VLLLVLILVLVAFGLLVVALLTGNVLSAWLSVAVSVAAAVVLVIDWLQRRAAVKAGRAGAESTSAPQPPGSHEELDPVTEVLPVYSESEEPEVLQKRPNRVGDGQQTVVMPAVQPSGSGGRPSGAEGPSTPSGGSSSPRVTEPGAGEGGGSRADEPEGRAESRSDDRSDAESTVVVDIRKAGIGESSAGADAPGGAAGSEKESGSKPGRVAAAAGL
jgi:hypothetical protein